MRGVSIHRHTGRLVLASLCSLALSGAAWGSGPSGGAGSGPQGGGSGGGGSTGPSGGGGAQPGSSGSGNGGRVSAGPLGRTGMWIWYVARSDGGNLNAIIATARDHAVGTVLIKSGDGTSYWPQFSSATVSALHQGGLRVCAWQYVYGAHPLVEAEMGAQAVRAGADCLVIDAEGEYQGRYAAAQTYLRRLRSLIGAGYPLGLASFPYVDYHPSFPYSVFLGPGGAQFNLPQMYWRDIGTSVDAVYSHTYFYNAPYLRPIAPLGEVAGNPPPSDIERFRQLRRVYRAPATSWWDWQSASARGWSAVSATVPDLAGVAPQHGMPTLAYHGKGARGQGDLVVWAQEHLWSAGYHVSIDGSFGAGTRSAVEQFQSAHGIAASGQVDPTTWSALLRYPAANVTWSSGGGARAAQAGGLMLPAPRSARLPALRWEIPPHLGQG